MAKKDIRQEKRAQRQEARSQKRAEDVKKEASSYGVNIDSPTQILTDDAKKSVTEGITKAGYEDLTKEIKGFSEAWGDIPSKQPTPIDKEKMEESQRKEKRERYFDVLRAIGAGFQGKDVQSSLVAPKLREEREAQYKQYQEAVEGGKKQVELAKHQYRKDLLSFLEGKLQDLGDSELDKLKADKLKAEIDKIKTQTAWQKKKPYYKPSDKTQPIYTHQTEEGNWKMTNQKEPYSDLYYKLTGNSPVIINEMAKIAGYATDDAGNLKRNLSPSDVERLSNTLLSKIFDIKVDDEGNRVAIPKPGKEYFLQELSAATEAVNNLKAEKENLINEMNSELRNVSGMWKDSQREGIKQRYEPMITDINNQISQSDTELKSMLNDAQMPNKQQTSQQTQQQTTKPSKNQDVLKSLGL